MKNLGWLCLVFLLLAAGCRSYSAHIDRGAALGAYHRYFVRSNLNDNHSLDRLIVEELQKRGFDADSGPETMMPRATQAMITYDDQWAWDFKYHLVGLTLIIRDVKLEKQVASADYVGPASMFTAAGDVVDQLLDRLLKNPSAAPTKKS